jgi:DNA sulfur modification protein DndD
MPVQGDFIESEINQVAPEQVSRFFLFDGELLQEYETLLIEGSDQGRRIKEAIEQVLGVPSLINGRDDISVILKNAQRIQTRDLRQLQGLDILAQTQSKLTEDQDRLQSDLTGLRSSLENARQSRQSLEDQLAGLDSVHQSKIRYDSIARDLAAARERQAILEAQRRAVLGDAWQDFLEIRVAPIRRQLEQRRQQAYDRRADLTVLRRRIDDLEASLQSKVCPMCRQPIGEDMRVEAGTELGRLRVDAERLSQESDDLDTVSSQLAALSKITSTLARQRLENIDRDLHQLDLLIAKSTNEMQRISDEIQGYDTAEIARWRAEKDEWLREEGRLTSLIAAKEGELEKVRQSLASNQHAIESQAPARSQRSTRKVALCTQIEEVFRESIESLRNALRQEVEARATEAFLHMTTQKEYQALRINKNYGLSIIDKHGERVTRRSAGAEQVVALSLIDGLNRTGRSVGPVVMDTPFARLDPSHRRNILEYLPTVSSQFVILVHGGEIDEEKDLGPIADRIGATYRLREISSRQTAPERL